MFGAATAHERLILAFSRFAALDKADRLAIRSLAVDQRMIAASTYIVREGQLPLRCAFLMDGFSFRQKLTMNGHRAIVSLQVPGDFIDVQNLFLQESDHDIVALTNLVVAELAIDDLRTLVMERPAINRALWIRSLVEGSIFREWLLNVGRRDAHARVAHLLCEISARLEAAGLARELTYELPMTQEQLGDVLGLTSVHINRVLKALEKEGLIRRRKREVAIADWQLLRRAADFNERYLHFGAGKAQLPMDPASHRP
jgi:CRP-like cAMP-binding protein